MSAQHSPYDGRPFYCSKCGAGWDEYGACEMPDCELESEKEAQERRDRAALAKADAR